MSRSGKEQDEIFVAQAVCSTLVDYRSQNLQRRYKGAVHCTVLLPLIMQLRQNHFRAGQQKEIGLIEKKRQGL
jgi:hypothetical protein